MAGDFNKPVVTDAYASVLQSIKDLIADLAKGLDGTGTTNVPVNTIRWSSANNRFEKYNGSSWAALSTRMSQDVTSVMGYAPGLAAGNLLYLDSNAKVPLANMYTGSGSGLNADMLDGVDISNVFRNQGTVAAASDTSATGFGAYVRYQTGFSDTILAFNVGGSTGPVQLSFHYNGTVAYRNQTGGTTWQSWRTFVTNANAPGAMNAQAAGTYGGMNITGSNGGWAGFQFNSTSRYFMSTSGQTGEYDTGASAWQWRWDNGTLAVGTVPWARLSGVPAMSFLGLSGGTMSGAIITTGNTAAFGSANETTLSIRSSGTSTPAAMSFHRPGSYAINMGLDTDNYFKIGGWSAGGFTFQISSGGHLWGSAYGWLHDYFTRTVNAGANLVGGGSGANLTLSHTAGYGAASYNLGTNYQRDAYGHLVNCNCNCNCCGGGG